MKLLKLITLGLALSACQDDRMSTESACLTNNGELSANTNCLIGSWKLTEVLMDPGDGSGVFKAVSYDKTISFYADGRYVSSAKVCSDEASNTGTYEVVLSVLTFGPCDQQSYDIEFWNGGLTLSNRLCIESCGEKYVRIYTTPND